MKKVFLFFILSFIFMFQTCYSKTISLETIPDDLSIKKGDKVVFKLNGNPTTGYTWQINIENPEILVKTNEAYKPNNKKLIGGSGTIIYTLKAQNKGNSVIEGKYLRPWEKTEPIKNFKLNVSVK